MYRMLVGLKQKQVARLLKLEDSSMISRWEKGECMPNGVQLLKLSIIYKTLPNQLYIDLTRDFKKELFPVEHSGNSP